MKPSVIGAPSKTVDVQLTQSLQPVPLHTGAVLLRPDQAAKAEEALKSLDFASMPPADFLKIGFDAEQALQRTLDGFLARLDKSTGATVFALFGKLEQGVADAKLPELLEKIQGGERPGMLGSLLGRFRGKRPEEVAEELMNELRDLLFGRTRTLADHLKRLEGELTTEMQKLFTELQFLDALKKSYAVHFGDFTIAAGLSQAFLEKARGYVVEEETKADPADVVAQARLGELRDKLRLLESRALALEGTYTRLPADQMVIQQIEQAGIATLQETATTLAARFSSIKMTLLSLQGAFAVKSVQQMAGRQAQLDRQLTELRGKALKEVAVSAALAPGDNRLEQAKQIEQLIVTTNEVNALVATARKSTEEKFEQARQKFAAARQDLANLASR